MRSNCVKHLRLLGLNYRKSKAVLSPEEPGDSRVQGTGGVPVASLGANPSECEAFCILWTWIFFEVK